ncbi:hypothetical protein [Clostridium estertheticum]|uniref:hypothetical protein n=1 Tax=Clostridium estertheticum TaxID=238834 RepID=UPI001C6F1861|nr:hypothetical protein [Clostridium estertheticum]MBW9154279.1 hypothetical protein [Clostridium estertheticum]WLC86705.1 hypothetical protein KTC97_22040 [Clostridium estertheticum]
MNLKGLFKKKLSIDQGEKLLEEYCNENGFEDNTTQWKEVTHSKSWIPYVRRSNITSSNNWVSYHPIRGKQKYSIWIDLITGEIREVLR